MREYPWTLLQMDPETTMVPRRRIITPQTLQPFLNESQQRDAVGDHRVVDVDLATGWRWRIRWKCHFKEVPIHGCLVGWICWDFVGGSDAQQLQRWDCTQDMLVRLSLKKTLCICLSMAHCAGMI